MSIIDKFNVVVSRNLTQYITSDDIVITDNNLFKHYKDLLANNRVIVFESGEDHKTLQTVEQICRELIEMQADRKAKLIGFGGGLVCDVTGLVGSLYMRGVNFKFIATSLLAQLDASVGGKNGVNLDGYKNIIGVFNNPIQVVCALDTLETLPKRELVSGYAEAIKCGMLASSELFNEFDKSEIDIEKIVRMSLEIKANIVDKDPKETLGLRMLLNLGHTFGHAIEKCAPTKYLHGEAIAIGLCYAAKGSFIKGLCSESLYKKVIQVIKNLNLPTETEINSHDLATAMLVDKKRNSNKIDFILIEDIGIPIVLGLEADISIIEEFLVSLRSL